MNTLMYEKDRATINAAIMPDLAPAQLQEEWRSLTGALCALDGVGRARVSKVWSFFPIYVSPLSGFVGKFSIKLNIILY